MAMSSQSYETILSHPNKQLKYHLENVGKIAQIFASMIPIRTLDKTIFEEVAYLVGTYHDIGKATPFFQNYLWENNPDKKAFLKNQPETRHSLLSATATFFAVKEHLKNKELDDKFSQFLPIASFLAVRRHHTDLSSAMDDIRLEDNDLLKVQLQNLYYDYFSFLPYWDKVYANLKKLLYDGENFKWPLRKTEFTKLLKDNKGVLLYLFQHLLYSLLLDADKHEATISGYPERKPIPTDIVEIYRQKNCFNQPRKQIDVLRNEIYQIVVNEVNNLDLNQDHILSLSAPTGAGKTLTSLAFAIKLRERIIKEMEYYPRIIYCLPFLSIIDQNTKIIEEVFKTSIGNTPASDLFLIHHHLSDYTYKGADTEYSTDEGEILIEGWDSEIIITTFVQLFHTLFSNRNRAVRKFHKIAGSIILLDEIQALPHKYWLLFKETTEVMKNYLGTYFILSTATQPAIFGKIKELLIDNEKYFKSFKRNKVLIKISEPMTIPKFANELIEKLSKNPKSTLVVLNTIRAAEKLFNMVKETLKNAGYEVYFLSSNVTPYERVMRIEKIIKSNRRKVIISTQLVEAGVDIDLECVIRDFGPMDSINQVAGRANRNQNLNLGEVEVIMLREEKNQRALYSYIYDPVLIDNTKRILEPYHEVSEDNFLALTTQYYQQILETTSDDTSREYLEAIRILNYDKIGEFQLIEEKGEKVDIFVELNEEASEIWDHYQKIMNIDDLRKRKQQFLEIRGRFYQYVISVLVSKARENLPPELFGIRFIPKSQLNEFYDKDTGFKIQSDTAIW